jgi:TldD protein
MLIEQINHNLITANELSIDFLQQQANKLITRGANFCDIYLQNNTSESWVIDEDIIKSGSFAVNQGIGVRAICNDKSFLSYSNALNKSSITDIIDSLFLEPVLTQEAQKIKQSNQINHQLYSQTNPMKLQSLEQKTNFLKNINRIGRSNPFVTNVIANLSFEYDEVCIIRSDDKVASDIRPLIHISISIVINHHGKIEKGQSGFGGRYSLDEISQETIDFHINAAYTMAILKSEAKAAPKGMLPVVLGNGWAGVILHEAVGHGLEGDFNRKGSSAFSNRIGQKVAHESVTVIDDGTIDKRRGSLNVDDEGNPTQKNVLIENGILKGYMFDELNARLMNTTSTGNGRRESFACSPMPRMTNTYMLGGKYTHDEIIASIEHGIYAENFEGGQVDITSGQFVFNASLAWLIKDGKLSHPIKGCALVGNGPDCLNHVTMVGNNMQLDHGIGVCGKNGQSVAVGVGQPTIRIDGGLVVGGV